MAHKNSDILKNPDADPLETFQPYWAEVRSFVARKLRSCVQSADVQDAMQELRLRLLRRSPGPGEELKCARAFLFATARYVLLDYWRDARRQNPAAINADAVEQIADMIDESPMNDPEKRLEDQQELLLLLNMLPPRERVALILRFRDEFKKREIGQKLGCSERRVGLLLEKAIKSITAARLKRDSEQ